MYDYVFYYLKDPADAEEVVAQTFLKITENVEKISGFQQNEMENYCVTVLKNETMNIFRERKRVSYIENEESFPKDSISHSAEEEFMEKVNKERLLLFIDKLSNDDKKLIYLRFANELSFKNISELLNISEEAAKKRCQRILKKLHSYYEEGDKIEQF